MIYIVFVIQAWKYAKRPGEKKTCFKSTEFTILSPQTSGVMKYDKEIGTDCSFYLYQVYLKYDIL